MSKDPFRVGDRVWTLDGWGVMKGIDHLDTKMPYHVVLDTGKQFWCREHEVFFHELEIPESARVRPHEFKEGDPVIVWNNGSVSQHLAAFCRKEGLRFCTRGSHPYYPEPVWDNCIPYERTLFGFREEELINQ